MHSLMHHALVGYMRSHGLFSTVTPSLLEQEILANGSPP
jgi:hypothetical protein